MGRWGHDRDDDTDGKPLTHLIRASQARERVRLAPKPIRNSAKKEEPKSRRYDKPSGSKLMDCIRELVLEDPELRPDDIAKEIARRYQTKVSVVTVSHVRMEFRAALKFLGTLGLLKTVTR